ncbi:MAG: ABC transporter permease [Zetaproteobacteria bacterium CG12_big_fil_rev_8_21_14_0_65_55_1124]|nr:MAG: ABC transporter permease [Zetaproteobacteria bacterium CG1_02_55_237]PIS19168.1 MAG: ABC transporter permease [Zetaproteobacteria bacterium CG08_land_8_20_14_0_20_55_17]PIW43863.1 MAG: ABC transporter permease [Zetaproteobacteria bacterium CG12_big_fil_rev_8_21_14_0_65_55_1124]PIY53009.1 MAG: ABC transporter permease [Zetaproteobacteria bacterium CG_4_10_14_0_8_um_filter_55_43]PIZ37643.1 MAG: ABC transporter permease [Zetaproteobacteria bacterium CG_4_10_14_0_2_um_filter_55_20]PJB79694
MNWLSSIGSAVEFLFNRTGLYALMLLELLRKLGKPPWYGRQLLLQAEEVGVQSLPVVMLTALFTGMVLALQSYIVFHRFAAESLTGLVVSMSLVRELGPVLVGLMVAGRVGASFAAELGTMRVTEQIDALWTLSTDPFRYLVTPRVLAVILMLPLLTVIADFIGIYGGYAISVFLLDQNPTVYIENTTVYMGLEDFYSGLVKACFFGLLIGVIGCTEGFNCKGGAAGVGTATTRAVVISCMSILVSDYFLTAWLFG